MQAGKVYPIGKVRYDTWKKVFETEVTASTPGNQLLSTFQGNHGATTGNADTGQVQTFAGTAQIVAPENPTFVGTAALDSVVKKFGRTSLLLDGNSDYIMLPDSDDWAFGTGDFTVDCWVNFRAMTASNCIFLQGPYSGAYLQTYIRIYDDGRINYYYSSSLGNYVSALSTTYFTINLNQWHHVAVVRSSGTYYFFVDGIVSSSSTTISGTPTYIPVVGDLKIGIFDSSTDQYFNGWIDEYRVSKGIARWTANFPVPTAPHVSDRYTPLLLHFAGTDGGTATSNSGQRGVAGKSSLLLDGDSDYVTVPDSDDWSFGTGDFTIDMWIKPVALLGSDQYIFNHYESGTKRFGLYINTAGNLAVYVANTDVIAWYREATPHLVQGAWNHVAIVRSGETAYIFINGTASALAVITPMGAKDLGAIAGPLYFGTYDGTKQFFNGQIDGFRVTKGAALWTSDFTPPTTSEDYAGTKAIPILNLQGDIDEQYLLSVSVLDLNNIGTIYVRINGDSGTNYGYQYLLGIDTALTAVRGTSSTLSIGNTTGSGQVASGEALMHVKSGKIRAFIISQGRRITGTQVTDVMAINESWNNTVDEVRAITVLASGVGTMGVSSRISLYKREIV